MARKHKCSACFVGKCSLQVRGECGFTLRIALRQRPPSVLLTAAAVPIHEGQPGLAQLVEGATPPLMVSRRRQRRAAAAPILAWSTSRRRHGLARVSALRRRLLAKANASWTSLLGQAPIFWRDNFLRKIGSQPKLVTIADFRTRPEQALPELHARGRAGENV
jgi:hypothetical protein